MKFRISITKENLEWILAQPDCPEDLFKVTNLALFKVGSGILKPAFEVKGPGQGSGKKAFKQLDEEAYRYLNNLMTEEEEAVYEIANNIG